MQNTTENTTVPNRVEYGTPLTSGGTEGCNVLGRNDDRAGSFQSPEFFYSERVLRGPRGTTTVHSSISRDERI
jgi:hypothetical protein